MVSRADDKWIDDLIVELRLRNTPGPAIGDAVASARELLTDSGQGAAEAFGSAREYAASLELPTASTRDRALSGVWLPVLGLIAFLTFTHASTAWFEGDDVRLSIAQAALLAVPVLLALTLPLYLRTAIRHRWLLIPLILVGGAAGALSAVVAPASDSEAWLVTSPLPWLVGTTIVMLALSGLGTALSLRSRATDEITDPLPGAAGEKRRRGWHPALVVVNWLFPIFAALVFTLTWTLTR